MGTTSEKMEEENADPENVSLMFLDGKKAVTADEQLALFMHRFNLDWETVETMPAFEEHRKALFSRDSKK